MFSVAQIPSETKEVVGESQHESLHLLAGIAVYLFGKFLDGLERQFFRRYLLNDLLDLLQLFLRNKGLAELLQVHGRAVIGGDGPDFIACQDVIENLELFETIEEPREQARARRRIRLRGGTCVE